MDAGLLWNSRCHEPCLVPSALYLFLNAMRLRITSSSFGRSTLSHGSFFAMNLILRVLLLNHSSASVPDKARITLISHVNVYSAKFILFRAFTFLGFTSVASVLEIFLFPFVAFMVVTWVVSTCSTAPTLGCLKHRVLRRVVEVTVSCNTSF